MCARYFLSIEEHENEDIVEEINRRYLSKPHVSDTLPSYGGTVVPTSLAPVLALSKKGKPGFFLMNFGLRTDRSLIINARAETVTEKPLFRSLVESHRCLIPANTYTEWAHTGKQKIPYTFSSPDGNRLNFAGIYRSLSGSAYASFVILTRDAPDEFSAVHSRMPLILNDTEQTAWLTTGADLSPLLASGLLNLRYEKQAEQQLSFL